VERHRTRFLDRRGPLAHPTRLYVIRFDGQLGQASLSLVLIGEAGTFGPDRRVLQANPDRGRHSEHCQIVVHRPGLPLELAWRVTASKLTNPRGSSSFIWLPMLMHILDIRQ
jgi:hypothetical protein